MDKKEKDKRTKTKEQYYSAKQIIVRGKPIIVRTKTIIVRAFGSFKVLSLALCYTIWLLHST
jgi:hypothetical protein